MTYNYLGDYMSFIYLFLIGILIGTAMIIPGVSGSVIAVIFGVYDKSITALTNLFKNFKKNIIYLFVLGSGILTGAIWFSNVMMFLYEKCEIATKLSFVGLILGGVPYLIKEIKSKDNEKINFLALLLTFILSVLFWYISQNVLNINFNVESSSYLVKFLLLFLSGIIYSIGKIIPGVSGSFLLIIIGMYEFVLSLISNPIHMVVRNFNKVVPFLLGFILGIIILLKLVNNLLEKKFSLTYSIIIGFVLGSVWALVPKFNFSKEYVIGIIIMIFSFTLSYKLSKK